ncbi:MAG: hypothetical protein WD795_09805 [Woeseia sp.]
MRQADVKKQFDAVIHNVESALRDLSDRLEGLPDTGKYPNPVRRAGRTLKRTADNVAERIPFERASTLAVDTGRAVRQHPVTTALTAAFAGYCIWSLIRYSNGRAAALKASRAGNRIGELDPGSDAAEQLRPAAEDPDGPDRHARH